MKNLEYIITVLKYRQTFPGRIKILNAIKFFSLYQKRQYNRCNMARSFSLISYSCQVSITIAILLRFTLSAKYLSDEVESETMPEPCRGNMMLDKSTGDCVERQDPKLSKVDENREKRIGLDRDGKREPELKVEDEPDSPPKPSPNKHGENGSSSLGR